MQLKLALYHHIKPTLFYLICFGPYYLRRPLLLMLLLTRAIIFINKNDRTNTWLMLFFCTFIDNIISSDILYAIYPVLYSQGQNQTTGITIGLLSYASPFFLTLIPYYHFDRHTEYLDIKYEINKFIESSLIAGMGFNNLNNIDD